MKRTFPVSLKYIGIPLVVSTWLLAGRLVWEQTVWTWEQGPQMVGFSLMHSGPGILLLLAANGGALWLLAVLIAALWSRQMGGGLVKGSAVAFVLAVSVMVIPYGFWQRAFIDRFTPKQAIDLYTYAAALGDLPTVSAFLENGVGVNAQGRNGTALHGAAVQGELEVIEFLIGKGADVNALNAYGNSPMANAVDAWQRKNETQALLQKHGGKLVRGTEEQRYRVIKEQLREDAEKYEKKIP